MAHLLVYLSAHGYGHVSQSAPVLAALASRCPGLQLTIVSDIPRDHLQTRINLPFTHQQRAVDFGFLMHDAIEVDVAASRAAYLAAHADWPARVAAEAAAIAALPTPPDLLLTNAAYLPLAASRRLGLPAVVMSSLNWSSLADHFFGSDADMRQVLDEIAAAYADATLQIAVRPGLDMPGGAPQAEVGPIASLGRGDPVGLRRQLGVAPDTRLLLVALGGIATPLDLSVWPQVEGWHYLVTAAHAIDRDDIHNFETRHRPFVDLLASVDAVVSKPGYGTFAEAACNGTPLLYVPRPDWPEQEPMIDWFAHRGRCAAISRAQLEAGSFMPTLLELLARPARPRPRPDGAAACAERLLPWLTGSTLDD